MDHGAYRVVGTVLCLFDCHGIAAGRFRRYGLVKCDVIFYPIPNRPISDQIGELLIASCLSGFIYFVAILPFLALLLASPFWQNRFEAVSGVAICGKEADIETADI